MTRVEKVAEKICKDLENEEVLEVACGCGEFSVAASRMAKAVHCIDLDSFRLRPDVMQVGNLHFELMDATAMTYPDASFDAVVMYNAIGHLDHILEAILEECLRVVRPKGAVYVISSFKMDQAVIRDRLLPILNEKGFHYEMEETLFTYVRVEK